MIEFVSLFAGIGGFDLGFERAGMRCAAAWPAMDEYTTLFVELVWGGEDALAGIG